MKQVAGSLKLQLAQYQELQAFTQFASDLDPETRSILERGERVRESLKQSQSEPLTVADQIATIHIVTATKILDKVPVAKIQSFIVGLREYLNQTNFVSIINDTKQFTPEAREILESSAKEFSNIFN